MPRPVQCARGCDAPAISDVCLACKRSDLAQLDADIGIDSDIAADVEPSPESPEVQE